ncbi:MAG TPA: hypothetical protein VLQ48_08310 [Chloroflexia bacterium]|nr:hypothetical protein [Chloroflexia bacterium]
MDSNTGTAPEAGGLSQAQESKLRSLGLTSDIIDDIRKANLPSNVLDKLDTISSPQQFATDIAMLWLPSDVTDKIRNLGAGGTPTTYVAPTPPQGNPMPAPTTPISDYTPPQQAQAQPEVPQQPQQPYAQVPSQGGYPQQQQGGYAPPPQGYPQQQGYPPQQGYPQQPYQQYPVAPPVKKSGVPAWVWIVGGIVLFFVLCFVALYALVFSVGKGITSVVNVVGAAAYAETFSTDMASGNYQGAHDTLGSNLANRYSVNTLQSKWEALVGANTFDSGTMGSPRTSGDNVIIPWTINGANGKTYNVDLYVSNVSSSADSLKIVDAKPDLIPSP